MEFSVKHGPVEKQRSACIVVGVHEKHKLSPAAAALDAACGGLITRTLKGDDIKGKVGDSLLLHHVGDQAERVLLVGCGKAGEALSAADYRTLLTAALTALKGTGARDALLALAELEVKERDLAWKVRQTVELAGNVIYQFDQLKSKKDDKERPHVKKVSLLVADAAAEKVAREAVRQGQAIQAGMKLTKDLANLPGNICTPRYLAEQAEQLAKDNKKLKATILDEQEMEKLGMGALLSVAKGSRQPPRLIVLEYQGGKKKDKPVVLVGKGLTFDAGGISLKPAAAMDEMKYDMCGGATVLGVMQAVAELELPLNVVGVVPSSENLPDGAANKPGDIVTSMSGQTIEILNTDAEGRLILCDALTYAKRFDPAVVIDIATLTGACVVALGAHASGLLGNDQGLVDALLAAGQASGDRAWQMPLWPEYDEQLKSPFADMANIGGKEAGTITAACFLARYTKEYTWAHLDIAGTAWKSGNGKGATGRPVPLLMQYLLHRSGA
ncbi:leucyl aminopeptidase [Sulfurivermis fontis]|uniref:leucyl aminopeptidase n=1 Tax=Sulfurivermis fontis TaxID=1972068 RepID=UPI000FD894B0|nr:leucyl aminopeptidase [Sulfurivermis fontis]